MKKLICFLMLFALVANAEMIGGPKGGKLLEKGDLRAEFIVNSEKHVEVYFYDADLNVITPTEQSVRILVNANGKSVLVLEQTANGFVSDEPLPEGEGYRIIVQISESPEGNRANFRIDYNTSVCGGCNRAEYACTCDHAE